MVLSQRARVLDSSEPVGGNQDGKNLGRDSIAEPKAANTMAFRAFIGSVVGNKGRWCVSKFTHLLSRSRASAPMNPLVTPTHRLNWSRRTLALPNSRNLHQTRHPGHARCRNRPLWQVVTGRRVGAAEPRPRPPSGGSSYKAKGRLPRRPRPASSALQARRSPSTMAKRSHRDGHSIPESPCP
jgi:hypothetical protein